MIVSVHIPKTAGTSFGAGLEHTFGTRLLLDYADRPLSSAARDVKERKQSSERICRDPFSYIRDYDAVHGHFCASKYFPLRGQAQFAFFFRDPIARTVSHYYQWQRDLTAPNELAKSIRSGKLTLEQFSAVPEMRHLYRIFLDGLAIERLTFVGITEAYDRSIDLFKAIFNVELPSQKLNIGSLQDDMLSRTLSNAIATSQEENAKIYEAARKRFDVLCDAHL